ncbi:MAG: Outer rane efflux protein [Acidobacteria bacterium]|nr:Outer rane efflux protein [Acidobacteriota bacterium]
MRLAVNTMPRLLAAACAGAVLLAPLPSTAQQGALGATLEGLLAHARDRHPEVQAMRHEADAVAQRVESAGALPDPMFKVELMNFTNTGNDASWSLSPANVGGTKYTLAWNDLAARIKVAYAQYQLVARNEAFTREQIALLGSIESLAQARYASGLAPQQDALRAQVELTGMRTELLLQDSERRQLTARLNALVSRPASAPLALPTGARPLPSPAALDPAALAERLQRRNPALAVDDARITSAERSRELTRLNRYPDFSIGVAPTQVGSRIAEWELMFEISIPLQQAPRRAQEAEAESMLAAARSRRAATVQQAVAELDEQLAALEAARRVDEIIGRELLPQASITLQSAIAAYENGRVDFATLLEAQRQIRKAQQDREKAGTEARIRLAEVERLVGEDL